MRTPDARGLIAVDKMGGTVLFIDPVSDETTLVLDDFGRVPHELLVVRESATAYVPIYRDGIHGRNPNQAICSPSSTWRSADMSAISTCRLMSRRTAC